MTAAVAVKSVFISGGTSGINLAIARAFVQAGACVTVSGRCKKKAVSAVETLRKFGTADYVIADVRDYDVVHATMQASRERTGPFDVVIAGAAGNFFAPAIDISPNGFKSVVDIDLLGTFHVFKAGFDFCARPGASFIAITAPQASAPMPLQAHVCAAKAGVNALVKSLALEWGAAGIRVNGLCPGLTAGTEGLDRLLASNPDKARELRQRLPLREYGSTEQLGDAALFLSGAASAYITGTILDVDGGYQLGDAQDDFLASKVKNEHD